ncbi:hypothetical protein LCGC14_1348080 [marine sediment metagenome]|uniref:Uncharacterized protein n=1 Tax=marine sediment metagenome TaxID=412755 RepID=A0A0F9MSG6_9ZZZZ
MPDITYKEMFDKSKSEPRLQYLIGNVLTTSVDMALKAEQVLGASHIDAGELMLNALSTIAGIEGFTLTNRDEITAEYLADILNAYGHKE